MLANGGGAYKSTVKTEDNAFYQPTTTFGATNIGSSYRVTGIHYGVREEQEEIRRVLV